MSSRARKKFAKQNDILNELAQKLDEEDEEIEETAFSKKKGKNVNAFDLVRSASVEFNFKKSRHFI